MDSIPILLIAVVLIASHARSGSSSVSLDPDVECAECCSLVYRTRVRDWPETSRKVWAAHLEWYLDDQEVRELLGGTVERYEIRHGRLACWGGRIEERSARYMTIPGNNASMTLHQLPLGYYGVQICSFGTKQASATRIDWGEAWTGTIDVGNINGHAKHTVRMGDVSQSTCATEATTTAVAHKPIDRRTTTSTPGAPRFVLTGGGSGSSSPWLLAASGCLLAVILNLDG